MSVPVVPTPLPTTPPIIASFNYNVNSLVLNSTITFNVVLLDTNNVPVTVKQVTLSGEAYTNWGNNDNYVILYICNELGLTPLNPIEAPPQVSVDPVVPVDPEVPV